MELDEFAKRLSTCGTALMAVGCCLTIFSIVLLVLLGAFL